MTLLSESLCSPQEAFSAANYEINPMESGEVYDDEDDNDLEFVPYPLLGRLQKKSSDDVIAVSLQPFYSYRKIVKGQRWKKAADMFRPAYGFGKRSPSLQFSMGSPFSYHSQFMANPYSGQLYEI